jgi:hypothetical protein
MVRPTLQTCCYLGILLPEGGRRIQRSGATATTRMRTAPDDNGDLSLTYTANQEHVIDKENIVYLLRLNVSSIHAIVC